MKYSWKDQKDRNRQKNRVNWSGQTRLAYVRHKPQHPQHVKVNPRGQVKGELGIPRQPGMGSENPATGQKREWGIPRQARKGEWGIPLQAWKMTFPTQAVETAAWKNNTTFSDTLLSMWFDFDSREETLNGWTILFVVLSADLWIWPPKGGRGCLMSPPCLESQGCHLIPLCYLLSCSSA